MKPTPMLSVLPNPFFALDAYGMPSGACRYDPEVGRPGVVHYIGVDVSIAVDPNQPAPNDPKRKRATPKQTVSYAWTQKPVQIPATQLHVDYIRSGAVLAADKASARACRIWFVEPAEALRQARAAAVIRWRAERGEDPPVETWDAAVGPRPAAPPPAASRERAPEDFFASPFAVPRKEPAQKGDDQ